MGEFIKRGNTEIKIGMLDELWVSRDELLRLRDAGYQGFYNYKFDNTIEKKLSDESTLFAWVPEARSLTRLRTEDLYEKNRYVHSIWLPLEVSKLMDHKTIFTSVGEHRKQNYYLPCVYTPEAEPLLGTGQFSKFLAFMAGERFDKDGRGRTIFACSSCGCLFSLPAKELDRINEPDKAKLEYWKKVLKPRENGGGK